MVFGYWIAIWTSDYWPLVVGGKAIASWIPYTIIGFEVMVLVGALSTVAGMFINSRIPKITMTVGFDPRFTHGDYGIWVPAAPDRARAVEETCDATERWRCAMSVRLVLSAPRMASVDARCRARGGARTARGL